jgi:hypothetical protein
MGGSAWRYGYDQFGIVLAHISGPDKTLLIKTCPDKTGSEDNKQ